MFHNNTSNIQKKKKKENDWAEFVEILPPSYLPCRFLHNLHSFICGETSENIIWLNIWFLKKQNKKTPKKQWWLE